MLLDIAGEDATEDFEDVGHSDEARKLLDGLLVGELTKMSVAVPQPSKPSIYQFQVDNLELGYSAGWPWRAGGVYFPEHKDIGKDLPRPNRKALEDLSTIINLLYVLLKKIWPHCDRFFASSVEQVFLEMDALWKLSMSLGVALHNSGMGTQQRADGFSYARNPVERLGNCVRTLSKVAHDTKLSASITPANFVAASAFTTKIQKEHSMQLTGLVQDLASLNLWLQLRSFDS